MTQQEEDEVWYRFGMLVVAYTLASVLVAVLIAWVSSKYIFKKYTFWQTFWALIGILLLYKLLLSGSETE